MASIYSYPLINRLADQDILVISDASNGNKTKSVTIGQLSEYFGASDLGVDNYVNGGSYSSGTLTLTRTGTLPDIDISGFFNGQYSSLTGTPTLATVATTGSYNDLSDQPTIPGGTVTEITTISPIAGGPITTTGSIRILQASTSTDGYLSSTDWNTFNNKSSFPGFGTTAGTALEGNTSLLQIGTTAGTALEGDTPVVEGTTTGTGGISAITEIRTLTSAEYSAITPAADVMYVIV